MSEANIAIFRSISDNIDTMPINREKDTDLRGSAQKVWNWLRGFQSYINDYKKSLKQSSDWPEEALQYTWVSSIKNPALAYQERVDQLAEYASISKELSQEIIEHRLSIEKKWFFYPLANPSQEELPKSLIEGLEKNFASDVFEPVVDITLQVQDSVFTDIEEATDLLKEIVKNNLETGIGAPRRMIFTVDPTVSTKQLSESLTKQVQAFRKEHSITENKQRPSSHHTRYIVSILNNCNYSKAEARKILSEFVVNSDPHTKRQTIHRLLLNY